MAMNSNPLRTPRVGSEHNALGWGRRGRAGERGKEEKGGALGHAAQNSMRAYLRAWCSTGSRPSAGRTKWSVTSLPVRFGVGRGRLPAQRLRRAGPDLDRPDHPGRAHLLLLRHRRDPRQLGVRALRQGSGSEERAPRAGQRPGPGPAEVPGRCLRLAVGLGSHQPTGHGRSELSPTRRWRPTPRAGTRARGAAVLVDADGADAAVGLPGHEHDVGVADVGPDAAVLLQAARDIAEAVRPAAQG